MFGLDLLRPTNRRRRTAAAVAGIALAGVAAATTSCSPPPSRPPNNVALNKQIAWNQLVARGWAGQAQCLVDLWTHESSWNVYATNPSSGAYGIPQALPGIKMASAGGDWVTNPATQIRWGLDYIAGRYGNPCNAWGHEIQFNWYAISIPVTR